MSTARKLKSRDGYVKSVSDHMKGSIMPGVKDNIITGEHLRSIADNNELKMKAIQNEMNNNYAVKFNDVNDTINDFKFTSAGYVNNHANRLDNLSRIVNQSLSRDNFKNYYKVKFSKLLINKFVISINPSKFIFSLNCSLDFLKILEWNFFSRLLSL